MTARARPAPSEDDEEQRRRQPGAERPRHRGDAEVRAQRVEGAAGQVEDLLDAEDELQPRRHQEQHGGVEDAAEHDAQASLEQGRPGLTPSRS